MTDQQNDDRQMFTGNWTCGKCGAAITELPFQPDPERIGQLTCRSCHTERLRERDQRPRQRFQGNWTCSNCGAAITELPFQPRSDREGDLQCRDCFRSAREAA